MRHTTNYPAQKNRCPHCGHRLNMVAEGTQHCTAAPRTEQSPEPRPCGCGKHVRNA